MADSAFKDGVSVAVPTAIASIDSIVTTLPAAHNFVIAIIQFDNTTAAVKVITAGNLELRRGTGAGDFLLDENDMDCGIPGSVEVTSRRPFVVLMGQDATPGANPTYAVHAATDATGLNAEVKFLVINGLLAAERAFVDGGIVNMTGGEDTVATLTTTFAAATAAQPHIIIAMMQCNSDQAVGGRSEYAIGDIKIKNGAVVLASNQFFFEPPRETDVAKSLWCMLVAEDAAGIANDTYTVTALDGRGDGRISCRVIGISGFDADFVDSGSVAVGTTRTVIASLPVAGFADGTDIAIGCLQNDSLDGVNAPVYSAGGTDLRKSGDAASEVDNQFLWDPPIDAERIESGYQGFVNQFVDLGAGPTYELGALVTVALDAAAEGKIVAIHIKDAVAAAVQPHIEFRVPAIT